MLVVPEFRRPRQEEREIPNRQGYVTRLYLRGESLKKERKKKESEKRLGQWHSMLFQRTRI